MIVSTFELLIKRIANVPGLPANVSAVFRRAIEGYFLTVSNLENRNIKVALKLHISLDTGNRVVSAANTQVFYDVNSTNNAVLTLTDVTPATPANIKVFQTSKFIIPARQTAIITVLPNIGPFIGTVNPDLEIRGFVELNQFKTSIFQGAAAAEVLTTPEVRGTFLDNAYPSAIGSVDELDFDQIAYSLPTASGKAQNTLAAVPPFIFEGPFVVDKFNSDNFRKLNKGKFVDTEIEDFIEMAEEMKKIK